MRWSRACCLAAAGLLLAAPGAMAGELVLRSASDGVAPSLEQLASQAGRVRDACVKRPVAIHPMTGARALARIEARLGRTESPAALRRFASMTTSAALRASTMASTLTSNASRSALARQYSICKPWLKTRPASSNRRTV